MGAILQVSQPTYLAARRAYMHKLTGNSNSILLSIPKSCTKAAFRGFLDRIDSTFIWMAQKLDLVIGGPPCQAYSLVGRSRSRTRMKKDKRNYCVCLVTQVFGWRVWPASVLFVRKRNRSSVRQESSGKLEYHTSSLMRGEFRNCGYETEVHDIVCVTDYVQCRNRTR